MEDLMPLTEMHLKILLPYKLFTEKMRVLRIIAETSTGSFGLLPQRLDCVAALVPGIFFYETEEEGEVSIAVDQGILIKAGPQVLVSVRQAFRGASLSQLHDLVKEEFLVMNESEKNLHLVMAKLDTTFLRQLARLHHE